MDNDLISRAALLRDIRDGLEGFPPFVDDVDKIDWILRWIEGAPTEKEAVGKENNSYKSECLV